MTSSRDIRSAYLDFFAERGHAKPGSGPVVLSQDPTLMFANAGMVQFKDVFTGQETRDYKRATTSQKCIRISGKHNDLDNVGVTARHHTFFEMLGNFSFGDYFKRDAIQYAWDFYMDVMKLDPERMVFTVFEGQDGYAPADEEAAQLWREVTGCDADRVIRCNRHENFWQMGDTGACGPCSEIHYYLGDDKPDPSTFGAEPDASGAGWFELWNLVFMQYDRQADGTMNALPAPSVDTGAGLERLAVVKQGVLSNYDTDLLRPLVDYAGEIAGKTYGGTAEMDDTAMRVIADHARCAAFMMSEGVTPDSGGAGYVLRRVMRRAIRFGHGLGIGEPFFHHVAGKVNEVLGDVYPQLGETRDMLLEQAEAEEVRFRRTLANGLTRLAEFDGWDEADGKRIMPGAFAHDLSATFGFPVDMTQQIGREEEFAVDMAGFKVAEADHKAKSGGANVGGDAVGDIYHQLGEELPKTEFVGYDVETCKAKVLALISEDGVQVDVLEEGAEGEIITDVTPFYGEKGGQAGDVGELRVGDSVFVVEDTQVPKDGLFVHEGSVVSGTLRVGDEAVLTVSDADRSATRRNHSATHLLHWALREVVGSTVAQKGSLVGANRLRFDYSATRALTPEEIGRVEDLVNAAVLDNTSIVTDVLPMDEAKERGAIGIFEEKYGDVVRVLTIGPSMELCGGTHAFRTGDIGLFKVLSEGGLAAGVRRIEATTGLNALEHLRGVEKELDHAAALLKTPPSELVSKVGRTLAQHKELQREIDRLKKELMSGGAKDLTTEAREIDGIRVLGAKVELGDGAALREMADQLRDKLAPAVILLGSEAKGKALLACSVSKDVTGRFKAGDIVKQAAAVVGGGGGGRPDFAQAGGSQPEHLELAVAKVYELTGAIA